MSKQGLRYKGWGSVPTAPARELLDSPILILNDDSLTIWSPEALADRVADLPRFVLRDQPNIRSRIGRLFEAYIDDRLRTLDHRRHRILGEKDLRGVLQGQTPDYVVANYRDMVIIEVSSMGLPPGVADGDPAAVRRKLDDYRRKRSQLEAAHHSSHEIAQRLLGLNAGGSVSAILVTQDAIPNNPVMFRAMEEESFVCTADEFELLLDLAEAGWSLPLLVSAWQRGGREIALGAALADQAAILSRDLGSHRWARAIAEQFDLRAA
jgi:hypothetical protein